MLDLFAGWPLRLERAVELGGTVEEALLVVGVGFGAERFLARPPVENQPDANADPADGQQQKRDDDPLGHPRSRQGRGRLPLGGLRLGRRRVLLARRFGLGAHGRRLRVVGRRARRFRVGLGDAHRGRFRGGRRPTYRRRRRGPGRRGGCRLLDGQQRHHVADVGRWGGRFRFDGREGHHVAQAATLLGGPVFLDEEDVAARGQGAAHRLADERVLHLVTGVAHGANDGDQHERHPAERG